METAGLKETLPEVMGLISHIIKLPDSRCSFDYDREADVLYISFRRPQQATETEMLENGILVRYRGNEVVGITIMDASKRKQ